MALKYTRALMTIAAPHFDPLVQFYCNVLAQAPTILLPQVYAEFDLSGLRLGIYRPSTPVADPPASAAQASALSLCLEVEDLEAAIVHLTDLGYPPCGKIRIASHGREIDAHDPDGNRLILYQPNPGPTVSARSAEGGEHLG